MNRRKAIKMTAGVLAAGGAGIVALTTGFKSEAPALNEPKKIELDKTETPWMYGKLDPATTAEIAYKQYSAGSCMYGAFSSIITQLSEKFGEPFTSFPLFMMKYGHGGIGGTGTICGSLNGAAAVFGLLIDNKKVRDALTSELFRWYETTALPAFVPAKPKFEFDLPAFASNGVLCHVSGTGWANSAGFRIDSNQRKERCRRLTCDVAAKTVEILNSYFDNTYITQHHTSEELNTCMTCHSSKGKLANTAGKMNCTSCHKESIGHKIFADTHYKIMDSK